MLHADRELQRFLALVARFNLTETEVAALLGVSVPTTRILLAGGVAPRCLLHVSEFNDRNGRARSRAELRLPERVKVSNVTEGPRAA